MYEWLCGQPPFSGSPLQIAIQHLQTTPPSLCEKNAALPAAVEQVVLRALAKESQQRFASVLAFVTALEEACLLHQNNAQSSSSSVDETVKSFPSVSKTSTIWNVPHRRNPFQMTGAFARCIDLEKMTEEEGAQFLLRRAKHIPTDAHLEDAVEADRHCAPFLCSAGTVKQKC